MAVNLTLKKKKVLLILVILGFLSSLYYFEWWVDKILSYNPIYIFIFGIILFYIVSQVYFLWVIYLNAKYPLKPKRTGKFKVDVFLPTYNEPVDLVENTLQAVVNMSYPHTTYLIDDGNKKEYKELAEKYYAVYISRKNTKDYKAGNINNVLKNSNGEIIAIFDIDHVPQRDYLDKVIDHFENPEIGVVQVALDHYNASESYVAKACCNMNDDFFAATMLGMNELGCAVIFGSNSVFRREALLSIGGYQPGLAEDLHTSVKLHAAGWKSAYVAQILAKGLVPPDLGAFFKQQLKWANGVFEVLFQHFPSLVKSLSINQVICYVTRMTYYLAGPTVFFHLLLTIYALFSSQFNRGVGYSDYVLQSLPFIFFFFLIQVYIKEFYFIKEKKKGFHLEGYLLVLGTWPVYTIAFLSALFRIKVPFIATPKKSSHEGFLIMVIPQIIIVGLLAAGIVYKIINFVDYKSLTAILFGTILIIIHYGVFYSVWENYKHRKQMSRKVEVEKTRLAVPETMFK